MEQLSPRQSKLVSSLVDRLASIRGIRAVVLGGSYARRRANAGSDIDLGIYYSEAEPFSIDAIRELAGAINDSPNPVVTDFYEWGPWVNGGAWLTTGSQRVDFIYRSLEHVNRVISDAETGRFELNYAQQPPFGFFSGTYLGEIAICVPLFDLERLLDRLKSRVATYPEALRAAVVQHFLWSAEFGLAAFARKFAARDDVYGTVACLSRAVNELILALFALNRKYLVNDKTALSEVSEFERVPRQFGQRVQGTLAHPGASSVELLDSVETMTQVLRETAELADGLYHPRYMFPK
jgi:hypothetical protein